MRTIYFILLQLIIVSGVLSQKQDVIARLSASNKIKEGKVEYGFIDPDNLDFYAPRDSNSATIELFLLENFVNNSELELTIENSTHNQTILLKNEALYHGGSALANNIGNGDKLIVTIDPDKVVIILNYQRLKTIEFPSIGGHIKANLSIINAQSGELVYYSLLEGITEDYNEEPPMLFPDTSLYDGGETVEGLGSNITVMAIAYNDVIKLRWGISDYELWKAGNYYGYNIYRYTTERDTGIVSLEDQYNSKITLANRLRPLKESQWLGFEFANNEVAEVAKEVLYNDQFKLPLPDNPTIKDAYDYQLNNENRLAFAHIAAERDYKVAKGLALGYEDNNVLPGEKYLYIIELNYDGFSAGKGITELSLDTPSPYNAPTELIAQGKDREIIVSWNLFDVSNQYSFFNIERSIDSINFTVVNEDPFFYTSEEEENPSYAFYSDTTITNNIKYFYRVKGITSFDVTGPVSEIVSATGKPDALLFQMIIDSISHVDNGPVTLRWDYVAADYNDVFGNYQVVRSEKANGNYELIGEVSNLSRSFTDDNPLGTGYYRVVATDIYGNQYTSPARMVQKTDNIPPAPPTGIKGSISDDGLLQLSWKQNTEDDLYGYRVMVANRREAEFIQISGYTILDTTFRHQLNPELLADSLYVRMLAEDKRHNFSDLTSIVNISRPDHIPPAEPILHKVASTPAGTALGWVLSDSKDVVRHEVQRKFSETGDWQVILTIPKEEEINYTTNLSEEEVVPTCYIDSLNLERRKYDYRMLAFDDRGNMSGSELTTVMPYNPGVHGQVGELEVRQVDEILAQQTIKKVALDWTCTFDCDLFEFTIYRSGNGSPMGIYKTVNIADFLSQYTEEELADMEGDTVSFSCEDAEILTGARYIYQLMGKFRDGTATQLSAPKTLKIQ